MLRAVDLNDIEARELARRHFPSELSAHLAKRNARLGLSEQELRDKEKQLQQEEQEHRRRLEPEIGKKT